MEDILLCKRKFNILVMHLRKKKNIHDVVKGRAYCLTTTTTTTVPEKRNIQTMNNRNINQCN